MPTALTPAERDAAGALYREYYTTLRKWAHSQARRTGEPLETCWDDLHDAFLKAVVGFDPTRGPFEPRLSAVATQRFADRYRFARRMKRRIQEWSRLGLDDELAAPPEPEPFDPTALKAGVGPDARRVLAAALDLPPTILESLTLGGGRRALASYLRTESGLSDARLRNACAELAEAVGGR